ncbi:MAG: polysaccharide biosynthesis/export family protein [Pseudomonadota bacterium]
MKTHLLALLAASVLLCACPSAQRQNQDFKTKVDTLPATTLGPGDVFDVRVYQEPDLSAQYQVGSDGSIQFPLIGKVELSGKTPHEAATLIASMLKEGYLKDPQVTILVKTYNSKRIYVMGQVAKPGVFAYEDDMNILRAIILAGGFTKIASKNKVLVTRKTEEGEQQLEVPVESVGRGEATNIRLQPGDIVFVPESIF